MRTKFSFLLLLLLIAGCKTYEVVDIYKATDFSKLITGNSYKTFWVEPAVEFTLFQGEALNGLVIESSIKENKRETEGIRKAFDKAIGEKFIELGLIPEQENPDLLVRYSVNFQSIPLRHGVKYTTTTSIIIRGDSNQDGIGIFNVIGRYTSGYEFGRKSAKDMSKETLSELDVFKVIEPVAGGDATR